jgi:hypothetical protein
MKVVALLLAVFVAGSQPVPFQTLARMFEYDRSKLANERLSLREERSGVKIYDYSFDSPVAGTVPGLLIVSQIPGRRPLILYGHWMLQGSPLRNKGEFLDEAGVMARSGAICDRSVQLKRSAFSSSLRKALCSFQGTMIWLDST